MISIRRAASVFGESNDPIFVDNLVCTSDENSLLDCPYNVLHQCDHSDDAGVQCFGKYKESTDTLSLLLASRNLNALLLCRCGSVSEQQWRLSTYLY